jgi:hypothetical protein
LEDDAMKFLSKWFPKYVMVFDPAKTKGVPTVRQGFLFTSVQDLDVYLNDDNVSAWCRENCKGSYKWAYHNYIDNERLLRDILNQTRFKKTFNGIYQITFRNAKDATLFKLTFSDVSSI